MSGGLIQLVAGSQDVYLTGNHKSLSSSSL